MGKDKNKFALFCSTEERFFLLRWTTACTRTVAYIPHLSTKIHFPYKKKYLFIKN